MNALSDRLRRRLAPDESLPTYRVVLAYAGEDPRIALRESADLSPEEQKLLDQFAQGREPSNLTE